MLQKVFGRLTAVSEVETMGKHRLFICKCTCGGEVVVRGDYLRRGGTASCGCIRKEKGNPISKLGVVRSSEYNAWSQMHYRCRNAKYKQFMDYGGRGIKVARVWDDFKRFYLDMGAKPTPKHSLDRIDVNGNYEPGNVRWATVEEQCNNRRDNHFVTHNGITQTISMWARATGINRKAILDRITRGWPVARALEQPIRAK